MSRSTGESLRFCMLWAVSGLIVLALLWPMLRGEIHLYDDLAGLHLPLRHFFAECLHRGEPSEWFPGLFCGFDLHGEGQVGMAHPLHRALYGYLPLPMALELELVGNYLALLPGTYLFLRRWSVRRDAALAAALAFTFGGFNFVHYMHLNVVAGAAHLPWLLLAIDGIARDERPRWRVGWGLGLALVTTSQILLSQPQVLWYSGMVEASYALMLAATAPGGARTLVRLAWWKVLGVLGGGVQLLPTLASVAGSIREKPSLKFLATGSLPPANLVQMLAPYLYRSHVVAPATLVEGIPMGPAGGMADWRTHEFGLYVGAAVAPLLAWLWLRRGRIEPGPRRLCLWAAIMGAAAFVLSLGDYSPLFRALVRVPTFNLFRVSARAVLILDLSLIVLASVALSDLLSAGRPRWRELWPLACVPAAAWLAGPGVAILARVWPGALLGPYLASPAAIGAGFALVVASTTAVALSARGVRGARAALLLVWAADMAVFSLWHIGQSGTGPVVQVAASAEPPPGAAGDRLASKENRLGLSGFALTGGYVSFEPRRRLDYTRPAVLRVSGTRWIDRRVGGRPTWEAVPDPLPRARLVAQAVASVKPAMDLERIDLDTTALVDAPPATLNGHPGRADLVSDRPGDLAVRTEADGRQLLVVSERFHKGWEARIDGRATYVARVNGDFLGCYVPAGTHQIRFRYRPSALFLGRLTSLVGLALMGTSCAAGLRPRSRRESPAPKLAREAGSWRIGGARPSRSSPRRRPIDV